MEISGKRTSTYRFIPPRVCGKAGSFGRSWAAVILLVIVLMAPLPVAAASGVCAPPNVLPPHVCDFDSFYGVPPRQVPQGWTAFVLSGDLTFRQAVDTFWGAPSLEMWSNGGTFKAGIYTQVKVRPGAGYRATVGWAGPNAPDTFGRALGLDPTGGTDPTAPTVVWGPMHWGPGRVFNRPEFNIDVKARAFGDTMTVFFLVDHNRSTGNNMIFVDAIALYPDESVPPLPTNTSLPTPTYTPLPPSPTATASPTPSPSPSVTPSATASPLPPTETPTSTPTGTATPSPTSTAAPPLAPTAFPLTSEPKDSLLPAMLGASAFLLFVGALGLWGIRKISGNGGGESGAR